MTTWPKEWLAGSPSRACPSCGKPAVRPVVAGYPSSELFVALDAGVIDVNLNGCSLPAPSHECSSCGQRLDLHPDGTLVPSSL